MPMKIFSDKPNDQPPSTIGRWKSLGWVLLSLPFAIVALVLDLIIQVAYGVIKGLAHALAGIADYLGAIKEAFSIMAGGDTKIGK